MENFDKKTIKTKLTKQIKEKRKAAKKLKKQAKEGVNYEIVVEMPHENEQRVIREKHLQEEKELPKKFWDSACEFEKVRKETEQKTGQILTSDVIDKVLSSTANAFFETGKKGDLDSEIDQVTQAESTLKGESMRNCFKRKSRRPKTAVRRNTNKLATGTHFGEEAWETRRNEMKMKQPFAEL